eukprot:Polyplicarium_translucidae@DN400_c0_g1_i1.p1
MLRGAPRFGKYNPASVLSAHGKISERINTPGMERTPQFDHGYRIKHNVNSFARQLRELGWDIGMHSMKKGESSLGDYGLVELLHGFPNPNPRPLEDSQSSSPPGEFALFCIVQGKSTPVFSSAISEELKTVFDSLFTKGTIADVDDPALRDLSALLGDTSTVELKSPRPGQVHRLLTEMLKKFQSALDARLAIILEAVAKRQMDPERQEELVSLLSSGTGVAFALIDLQTRSLYTASVGAGDVLMSYEGEPITRMTEDESFSIPANRVKVRSSLSARNFRSVNKIVDDDEVVVEHRGDFGGSVMTSIQRKFDPIEDCLVATYRYGYGDSIGKKHPYPIVLPRPSNVPSGSTAFTKQLTDLEIRKVEFEATKKLEFVVVVSRNVLEVIERFELLKLMKEDSELHQVPRETTTTTATPNSADVESEEETVTIDLCPTRLDLLFDAYKKSEEDFSPQFDDAMEVFTTKAKEAALLRVERSLGAHVSKGAKAAAKELARVASRYRDYFRSSWDGNNDITVIVGIRHPIVGAVVENKEPRNGEPAGT